MLSLKCGYPLNRGATKVGFHCTTLIKALCPPVITYNVHLNKIGKIGEIQNLDQKIFQMQSIWSLWVQPFRNKSILNVTYHFLKCRKNISGGLILYVFEGHPYLCFYIKRKREIAINWALGQGTIFDAKVIANQCIYLYFSMKINILLCFNAYIHNSWCLQTFDFFMYIVANLCTFWHPKQIHK